MADDRDFRTRVSLKRVAIFIGAIVLLIFLMGNNPLSRALDDLVGSVGSIFGFAKGAISGRGDRVYGLAALAMVLIAVVGIVKLIKRR